MAVHDVVHIRLTGRAAPTRGDGTMGAVFQDADSLWMQIGAHDVVPAVELAVRFLDHVGQRAVVWSHSKYAYGVAGRVHGAYTLPPATNVLYEIELLEKLSTDPYESPASALQLAAARKDQANDMYTAEWYQGLGKTRIQQAYQRIAKDMEALLQTDDELPESMATTAHALRIDALNNLTAVLLRAQEYHAAKATAVQVLELDPDNFKALIRAAKAALMDPSSEFAEVELALQRAAQHAGNHNDAVREDIARLTADFGKRKQAYEQASKQMYQKAFASSGKQTKSNSMATTTTTTPSSSDGDATNPKDTAVQPPPPQEEEGDTDKEATPTSTIAALWNNKLLWNYILPYGFQITLMMTFLVIFMRQTALAPQESMEARQPPPPEDEF